MTELRENSSIVSSRRDSLTELVRVYCCLLAVLLYVLGFPTVLYAAEFHLLSSWSPAYIGRPEIAGRYIENLERRVDIEISIRTSGPEAIPPFEQLEPTAVGLVDMLFTHGAYHVGETGIGVALGAVRPGPRLRRSSGLWSLIDAHYRALGLKVLSLPTSSRGYHVLLNKPVSKRCDLQGRKIRGSPVYHGLIRSLNATPVVLPAGEIYAALEKGVIDGAAWPAAGSLPFRWFEVSKYFLRPTFGATTHLLLMNLERFESLADDLQNALLAEGERLELDVHKRFDELVTIETNEFTNHGLVATQLCGEQLQQLETSWANGAWRLGIKKSDADARQLRDLARAVGLAQ